MSTDDVSEIRVSGGFASRRLLYRALAQALAGAEPPAGAVFESTLLGPPPDIYVRPAHLLGSPGPVALSGVRATVAWPTRAPPHPPAGALDRFGLLLPSREEADPRWVVPTVPPTHPSLAWCGDVHGWAGVQVLWVRAVTGRVLVATRFRVAATVGDAVDRLYGALAARLVTDWQRGTGTLAAVKAARYSTRRDWGRVGVHSFPRASWCTVRPDLLEETPEIGFRDREPPTSPVGGHTIVLGASGTGKTTLLAHRAARAIAGGRTVVAIDLHGDLAPAVLAALSPEERRPVVAVDAGVRPVMGVAGLVGTRSSLDRAAAHFVAAVKRLTPDGSDLAWGFRLERIFDTFSRLVLESGGSLLDLYALLTDARRREAALLESHRPETARFLEELGPIVRRNPEFLWSAATRLSKVVLVPELAELLAPTDGGLEVERLLMAGRSVLIRLPLAKLGPEAAGFAATLVLGRIYLGLVATAPLERSALPILLVLDEVQGFAPRLVSEILSDSRKFGLEAWLATQYPERLAVELRAAAAGAASTYVAFRVPAASAAHVGPWVGLSATLGAEVLSTLPAGVAIVLDPSSGTPRWHEGVPASRGGGEPAWEESVLRTRSEFGVGPPRSEEGTDELSVIRVLLAILAAEERGHRLRPEDVVRAASQLPGAPIDPAELERAWTLLARGAECVSAPEAVRLTASGERRVGLVTLTGAPSESAEHRALLVRAFRVFARHGTTFEILRQGRFDTMLPDGVFRQLGSTPRTAPVDVARTLDRVRAGWAWRCFRGRDVHLEAEVSGALRPERIRRGWAKAEARGAFVLFLVGDPGRARRVRATLRALGLRADRAQVWTLGPAWDGRARPRSGPESGGQSVSLREE